MPDDIRKMRFCGRELQHYTTCSTNWRPLYQIGINFHLTPSDLLHNLRCFVMPNGADHYDVFCASYETQLILFEVFYFLISHKLHTLLHVLLLGTVVL